MQEVGRTGRILPSSMPLEVSITFRRFRELRKFKRSFRSVPIAESENDPERPWRLRGRFQLVHVRFGGA
jgi:hypothetical protein